MPRAPSGDRSAHLLTQVCRQFGRCSSKRSQTAGSTQFLIDAGNSFRRGCLCCCGSRAALMARTALRQDAVGLAVDRVRLRLPVVGGLMKNPGRPFHTRAGHPAANGVALISALPSCVTQWEAEPAACVDRASLTARGGGIADPELQAADLPPRPSICCAWVRRPPSRCNGIARR